MDSLDLECFRAPPTSKAELKRKVKVRKPRNWFLKGPIPGEWLSRACRLSRGALRVSLALWYLVGVERTIEVKLTCRVLEQFDVGRHTAYRALKELESAGLVTVVRHSGRCPVVFVVTADDITM